MGKLTFRKLKRLPMPGLAGGTRLPDSQACVAPSTAHPVLWALPCPEGLSTSHLHVFAPAWDTLTILSQVQVGSHFLQGTFPSLLSPALCFSVRRCLLCTKQARSPMLELQVTNRVPAPRRSKTRLKQGDRQLDPQRGQCWYRSPGTCGPPGEAAVPDLGAALEAQHCRMSGS